MIDTDLIETLIGYIQKHQSVSEAQLISLTVANSAHTTETATEWFEAFYKGLHQSLIIDTPDFAGVVAKVVSYEGLPVVELCKVMEKYLQENPLQYVLQNRKIKILAAIARTKALPNTIMVRNDAKFNELDMLESELTEVEVGV